MGQTRSSSTAAHPAQPQHAPAQAIPQQRQPGMLAQAASTMGGAMAGSVIGHGISNMLFGGGRPVDAATAPPPEQYAQQVREQTGSCDQTAKDFTKCLDATGGDMGGCAYYLDALKACQAAAKNY
ncbi:hypothetical protein BCR39DRAFT_562279 [Naematelia encephala]|uniref:CHCH domain-containing protein n=1 Tax=Naematelia encephala TaxID=71784 RepID=A0A1Y2AJ31_9TREE|nr:hypothetical protein BCR39DRAFT_562279 [Naematelia encephala]